MIHLYKNYYTDRATLRRKELDEVRRRDEANRLLTIHAIPNRPTFAEMFRFVNDATGPTDANIVANADISFDESVALVEKMDVDECYMLCRWDDTPDGLVLFADAHGKGRVDSQDAWCFRGPMSQQVIDKATFHPGQRGCDNSLGAILGDAGYRMSNPALSIKAIHLHRTEIRHHGRAVPKPFLCIPPHALGDVPELRWNREAQRV